MTTSVVVCTYNRSALLGDTLVALRRQQPPPGGFEILVVDNNSSDDTRAVTAQLAAAPGARITYILEERQGLSIARNTGIRAAGGDIVVFVDDDVDLEPDWLMNIVAAFEDPTVGAAGGPIRPIWPSEKPSWLTKDWEGFLSITECDAAKDTGDFRAPTYPWGANMAFRRTIFDEVGFFPTDLGRTGRQLLSNEEVSVYQRIDEAGHRIRFAPGAVVHHKISADRLTKQYLYHRAYYQGRSDAILDRRATNRAYRRVRDFSSSAFWEHLQPSGSAFETRCRERLCLGYLSQLSGLFDDGAHSREYQKLRALKLFVTTMLRISATQISERQRHLETFESLVRERDAWLAERDAQITQRQHHVDVVESLVRERDRWLTERDRQIAELSADRDNWQQLARDRERSLWMRVGRRLGLLGGARAPK